MTTTILFTIIGAASLLLVGLAVGVNHRACELFTASERAWQQYVKDKAETQRRGPRNSAECKR